MTIIDNQVIFLRNSIQLLGNSNQRLKNSIHLNHVGNNNKTFTRKVEIEILFSKGYSTRTGYHGVINYVATKASISRKIFLAKVTASQLFLHFSSFFGVRMLGRNIKIFRFVFIL